MCYCALLALAFVHLIPVLPGWSTRAYRFFMQLSILGFGYKLYLRHGLPRIRPMTELQAWLTRVVPSNDFHFAVLGLMFGSSTPMSLALLPTALAAAAGATAYGATHLAGNALWQRTGGRVHALLTAKQREAALVSAGAEVAVGLLLVLGILGPNRHLLLCMAYWNMLKLRYLVSEASGYHRQIWQLVGAKTAPLRARAPFLHKPLEYATRWFTTMR